MGDVTGITWTDHTFNPWVGCARVSPGCQHCYAEALDHRWGNHRWGKDAPRQITSDANWRRPLKWNRDAEAAGRPALVFCASMADVFEARHDLTDTRHRLWELIDATPHLIWQLLTKRPENVMRMVPIEWVNGAWPDRVWIGTTVEDQQRAIDRIPELIQIPAAVRFISCEPMLEPLDLWVWFNQVCPDCRGNGSIPVDGGGTACERCYRTDRVRNGTVSAIQWVIAGGESGPGHRTLDLNGPRVLRELCADADVPFFFKQHGGATAKAGGDLLDGDQLKAFPEQAGPRDGTPVEVGARG